MNDPANITAPMTPAHAGGRRGHPRTSDRLAFAMRASLAIALFAALPALAQPIPGGVVLPPAPTGVQTFADQGTEFSIVNTAGVRPPPDFPGGGRFFNVNIPSFAIARTEVVESQLLEFHNTMAGVPTAPGDGREGLVNLALNGLYGIRFSQVIGQAPTGRPIYGVYPGAESVAVRSTYWLTAAMYCNWLHNGRQPTVDAITNGAYDIRGVRIGVPDTFRNIGRQSGARYWLPSDAEWSIATYWDPNHPTGAGGDWWHYSYGRNRLPISGLPAPFGTGETSYGVEEPEFLFGSIVPVASYTNQQSPWGLFDTSGGAAEWLDTSGEMEGFYVGDRLMGGTPAVFRNAGLDEVERLRTLRQSSGGGGLRIATAIPTPGTVTFAVALLITTTRRRRS
jgi:hypothetical protein